jgi:MarR family transcriptional regulator, organic hydroperoxide resistance regulator
VRRRLSSSDGRELLQVEEDVAARLRKAGIELEVDFTSMAAVANVFRVASAARNHLERTALARAGLSFTAFTVMWVLWVWGESEFRDVAVDSGVAKGTLTGVVTTLERRGLVARRRHPDDRRLILVSCTPQGEDLMVGLFPRFNDGESRLVSGLADAETRRLAQLLRKVLRTIEELDEEGESASGVAGDRQGGEGDHEGR